jgi:predicted acylesterase/phospholipase RssA/CRP-like cAMP-binding protein
MVGGSLAGGRGPTALADLTLFAGFDDQALAALAASVEPVALRGGEVLMRQGEPADGAYVVQAGRLRATVTRADGQEQVMGEIGRGEIVGEMALLTEEPRSATVTAVRDTQLLRLPGDALATLFAHPQALRSVTTQLVRRLRHTMHDGPHRSLVATLAVVPLSTSDRARDAADAIGVAVAQRVPTLASITGDDTGSGEALDAHDLDALERDHTIVVYRADPSPTAWTERCLRQADLVLLVADATDRHAFRPVETAVAERRRKVPVRTELVLAHGPGTVEPHGTAAWLDRREVHRHHHVRVDRADDAARVARLLLDRPVALVLSGGGARGMAEVGVIRALEERGVPIDVVAGTSAGALVGGAVARGWSASRIESSLRAGLVGSTPVDPTFPAVALATGRKVTDKLRAASGDLDLEDLWRPFFCVSTNLSRNRAEVHRRGPGWRAVRASFAIPGVFPPVPQDGDVLVDGGLLDNLPVGRMRTEHEGAVVIAVDVGARRDLPAGSLPDSCVVSGWPHLWQMVLRYLPAPWGRSGPGRRHRDPVNILRVMTRLTELGAETGDDEGDLMIRPQVQDLPILDFDRFDTFVERGHAAAVDALGPWLAERGDEPW